ncbi:MAG: phosphatidate cytidylyltransferase [Clostridiales bacterium]|nr:phosphatidate cytidylyltransferase [Clostridiales bacterium]
MLKRTITGSCLVAFVVGFFFLRLVDVRYFDILLALLMAVGTFEMLRAFSNKGFLFSDKAKNNASIILGVLFSLTIVPTYLFLGIFYCFLGFILFGLIYLELHLILGGSVKGFLRSIFSIIYPNVLIVFIILINHFAKNSLTALLLTFVISSSTDVFAYLVGSLIGGKKLCPRLSPKKTISGAVGGLVGGIVACLVVYFIVKPSIAFFSPILFFILLGIISSVSTQIGDLFESGIKRKLEIKDMGKILPGHGGVLDRIDGISFNAVIIYIAFLLV